MSLINQVPAYAITAGDHAFSSVQIENKQCTVVQLKYADIVATDVQIQLEMSPNNVQFDPVPGSQQIVDPSKPSHTWNWPLPPTGVFVRAAVKNCSGKAGTVSSIEFLL